VIVNLRALARRGQFSKDGAKQYFCAKDGLDGWLQVQSEMPQLERV